MRFGFYVPNEGPFSDVSVLASLAADAEAGGWDGFFIWDALLPVAPHSDIVRAALGDTGEMADVIVALTAIATRTTRIRFGPLVSPLPRLRPELLARQTATLDRFSGGRLILGIGLGNPPDQIAAFGGVADVRERAAMVDEFLDLLTHLWSGRTVSFHGDHYTADNVRMAPTPRQTPRVPIWVGADSTHRAPRRRAARWDGFVPASDAWPDGVISVDSYREIAADIRRQRDADAPYDLVVIGNADGTRPAQSELPAYAGTGVTWVLMQAFTVDGARRRIREGPPKSV